MFLDLSSNKSYNTIEFRNKPGDSSRFKLIFPVFNILNFFFIFIYFFFLKKILNLSAIFSETGETIPDYLCKAQRMLFLNKRIYASELPTAKI